MKALALLSLHIGLQAESRRFAPIRNQQHSRSRLHPKRIPSAVATLPSPRSFAAYPDSMGTLSPSAETLCPAQSA
jgi:hypothetical protein